MSALLHHKEAVCTLKTLKHQAWLHQKQTVTVQSTWYKTERVDRENTALLLWFSDPEHREHVRQDSSQRKHQEKQAEDESEGEVSAGKDGGFFSQ